MKILTISRFLRVLIHWLRVQFQVSFDGMVFLCLIINVKPSTWYYLMSKFRWSLITPNVAHWHVIQYQFMLLPFNSDLITNLINGYVTISTQIQYQKISKSWSMLLNAVCFTQTTYLEGVVSLKSQEQSSKSGKSRQSSYKNVVISLVIRKEAAVGAREREGGLLKVGKRVQICKFISTGLGRARRSRLTWKN